MTRKTNTSCRIFHVLQALIVSISIGCISTAIASSEDDAALIDAAKASDMQKVHSLLSNGADVNAKDKQGRTALMIAARDGDLDVAELLLSNGAGVNAADDSGTTALGWATLHWNHELVEILKNAGAKE